MSWLVELRGVAKLGLAVGVTAMEIVAGIATGLVLRAAGVALPPLGPAPAEAATLGIRNGLPALDFGVMDPGGSSLQRNAIQIAIQADSPWSLLIRADSDFTGPDGSVIPASSLGWRGPGSSDWTAFQAGADQAVLTAQAPTRDLPDGLRVVKLDYQLQIPSTPPRPGEYRLPITYTVTAGPGLVLSYVQPNPVDSSRHDTFAVGFNASGPGRGVIRFYRGGSPISSCSFEAPSAGWMEALCPVETLVFKGQTGSYTYVVSDQQSRVLGAGSLSVLVGVVLGAGNLDVSPRAGRKPGLRVEAELTPGGLGVGEMGLLRVTVTPAEEGEVPGAWLRVRTSPGLALLIPGGGHTEGPWPLGALAPERPGRFAARVAATPLSGGAEWIEVEAGLTGEPEGVTRRIEVETAAGPFQQAGMVVGRVLGAGPGGGEVPVHVAGALAAARSGREGWYTLLLPAGVHVLAAGDPAGPPVTVRVPQGGVVRADLAVAGATDPGGGGKVQFPGETDGLWLLASGHGSVSRAGVEGEARFSGAGRWTPKAWRLGRSWRFGFNTGLREARGWSLAAGHSPEDPPGPEEQRGQPGQRIAGTRGVPRTPNGGMGFSLQVEGWDESRYALWGGARVDAAELGLGDLGEGALARAGFESQDPGPAVAGRWERGGRELMLYGTGRGGAGVRIADDTGRERTELVLAGSLPAGPGAEAGGVEAGTAVYRRFSWDWRAVDSGVLGITHEVSGTGLLAAVGGRGAWVDGQRFRLDWQRPVREGWDLVAQLTSSSGVLMPEEATRDGSWSGSLGPATRSGAIGLVGRTAPWDPRDRVSLWALAAERASGAREYRLRAEWEAEKPLGLLAGLAAAGRWLPQAGLRLTAEVGAIEAVGAASAFEAVEKAGSGQTALTPVSSVELRLPVAGWPAPSGGGPLLELALEAGLQSGPGAQTYAGLRLSPGAEGPVRPFASVRRRWTGALLEDVSQAVSSHAGASRPGALQVDAPGPVEWQAGFEYRPGPRGGLTLSHEAGQAAATRATLWVDDPLTGRLRGEWVAGGGVQGSGQVRLEGERWNLFAWGRGSWPEQAAAAARPGGAGGGGVAGGLPNELGLALALPLGDGQAGGVLAAAARLQSGVREANQRWSLRAGDLRWASGDVSGASGWRYGLGVTAVHAELDTPGEGTGDMLGTGDTPRDTPGVGTSPLLTLQLRGSLARALPILEAYVEAFAALQHPTGAAAAAAELGLRYPLGPGQSLVAGWGWRTDRPGGDRGGDRPARAPWLLPVAGGPFLRWEFGLGGWGWFAAAPADALE